MASWTDIIPQFKPYVEQLPVEAMVKVGMQKQAQYEEGVKKIQAQIDSVSGLDILRNVDKNYLQSKLDELGSGIKGLAAADFSNFQLVNSVTGMTKQITKDKYIQAAISSTANHRKQVSEMEADKKKGILTPDNEYHYSKQLSSYVDSQEIKDAEGNPITFSGKYIPHFDVFKFAKETFDAVKPDGFSFDQVYVTDANGKIVTEKKVDPKTGKVSEIPIYSPTLVRMEQEGIFPSKVKDTLSQIFSDPRVGQQLNITGQYNYRNFTPDQLTAKILDQKQDVMAAYQNQLSELNLKKNSGKDVQKEIDDITRKMQSSAANYDEYAKLAATNPDGVRGQIYKDDVSSRYTTMFGQIKKKEQTLDNPGWNANFKLMQEANDQSRFAQELHQRKLEFSETMRQRKLEFSEKNRQWQLDYLQKERLDGKKKPGEGTGPGAGGVTQADQPSNIDIINTYETDYNDAATKFKGASDEFIWNNAFSGIGNNDATLKRLIDSGMDRNSAISLVLDNTAKASKRDPLEFRTSWGNKAEVNYFKMTPQQRAANPSLNDSYTAYRDAKKGFDVMSAVKGKIDERTRDRLGPNGANQTELTGMVPSEQTINFRGNKVKLSKQDIYDMAVYLRGNESTFGFINDSGANQAAKTAYQRLALKGLADLADYQLDLQTSSTTMFTKTPITGSLRAIKLGAKSLLNPSDAADAFIISGQVKDVYNKISNREYEQGLQTKADIIKSAYGIKPNLKVGLMSDDVGVNKVTLSNIKNMSGAYVAGQTMNLSPDLKEFAKYVGGKKSLEDANIEAQVIIDQNNKPQVELVAYDDNGKRAGGMTIQRDEAINMGIDVNALYESREVSMLRNKINFNNGRTSAGNPKDITTYVSGDVYFDRHDFKGMGNAPYDVKANVIYQNGIYYPIVYVSDGKTMTKIPRELEGSENLQQVVMFLKQSVNPTLVSSILAESALLNQ